MTISSLTENLFIHWDNLSVFSKIILEGLKNSKEQVIIVIHVTNFKRIYILHQLKHTMMI